MRRLTPATSSGLYRECMRTSFGQMEWRGGNVHGRSGVREYWVRQWQVIDPRVDPQGFEDAGGKVIVDVHQVVRDLKGKTISDRIVRHSFVLKGGLVKVFKIV